MILRRVIKHFRHQEWTAIFLDFVIVVVGVGVAMVAQQWLGDRQQRAEMRVAETALQGDLFYNYAYAKERLAVAECRKQAYQVIAEKLLAPGDDWAGMPRANDNKTFKPALPVLLRSPSRNWGSRIWDAGLARGTFNQMDDERRTRLDQIFKQTQHAEVLQRVIYTLQGRLKTLAVTTTIGQSDRLRYYDMLGEIDAKSGLLELISGQLIANIEAVGIKIPDEEKQGWLKAIAQQNESGAAVYGDCYVPIQMSIFR
ncbi:hypothetical protein MNBD_ALPHA06-604 [hydrothermal vent metagenome]|uniref:Uncharacterized protein n=1 Tax=hydrothermal vent metagenome TaxID=652676 RepID=A0A3B0S6M2_9ZZZZ